MENVIPEKNRIKRFIIFSIKMTIVCLTVVFLLLALTLISLLYLRSQPLPQELIEETTTIYDHDGQILNHIHQGQNRIYIPLNRMPEKLINAFTAVEDQRFYEHFGFDIKRIGGAVVANLRDRSYSQGASTISQQLARNLYLTHDKTWERKFNEAVYTIQLEMLYSKDEIIEKYLNQIYFGHSAYGVEAASRIYFGKSAQELTLAESALLAGIPKGPKYYSPWLNNTNSFERQKLVLQLMDEQGYITSDEREQALAEKVKLRHPDDLTADAAVAPYFRDYVRQVVTQKYGLPEETFDRGGLRIYTTLDPEMQHIAEQALENYLPEDRPLQGSLLAVDPENGHIKAMVGGRDYQQSQFNRVFALRHPGSSLKPFLYYAALEQGLTPLTLMKSEPTTFEYDDGRSTYTPKNFNDSYANDYITLEKAIAQSDNIYAVKTYKFIGGDTFVDTLKRFNFQQSFQPFPSLALGAQGVTLFEMVYGYATFANNGTQAYPLAITKIEDREGNILIEEVPHRKKILHEEETFVLNHMLKSVFEPGGTGHRVADRLDLPVSGKTGSTLTDAWMMGFTADLVAGVWVGYDKSEHINNTNDGRLASYIWSDFLQEALHKQAPSLVGVPAGVSGIYINPDNGKLATEHCPVKRLIYFKEGTGPTEYCQDHLPEDDNEPTSNKTNTKTTERKLFEDWWNPSFWRGASST